MFNINKITLLLSNRCNLKCSYCFVSTENEEQLSEEQISIFIRWFLQQKNTANYRELDIFGGEPFFEFELLKMAIQFFKKHNRDKESRIHTIPVNGTILTEEILRFIKKEKLSVSISLDGNRANNTARKFKQGKDCFDTVWSNMNKFKDFMGYPPQIKMTVTPDNVKDLCANVRFLVEKGFYDVYPNPAHIKVKWSKDNMNIFLSEFEKMLHFYVLRRLRKQPIQIAPIDCLWGKKAEDLRPEDFHCGFGTQPMLHPDGNIYVCEQGFSGKKHWKDLYHVGSIAGGKVSINLGKMQEMDDYNIFTYFDLRNKNHPLSAIWAKMACCSFDELDTLSDKEDIENALDMYLLSSELTLKHYDKLKKTVNSK
ncbi:MAG: radical SAM protein [Candidatus Omnitrophica bacterium]|nr:radical SAM protein [Candidatus Omnitrophota bacterium]